MVNRCPNNECVRVTIATEEQQAERQAQALAAEKPD